MGQSETKLQPPGFLSFGEKDIILQNYIDSRIRYFKKFNYQKELQFEGVPVRSDKYVYAFYQSIYNLVRNGLVSSSIPEILHKNIFNTDSNIKFNTITLYLRYDNMRFDHKKSFNYKKNPGMFSYTLKKIKTNLDKANFLFIHLDVQIGGGQGAHANTFLLYTNPVTGVTRGVLYEPHGATVEKGEEWKNKVSEFLQYLTDTYNKEFKTNMIFTGRASSCPAGIQSMIRGIEEPVEEIGYCLMFSYFWMYMVMSSLKDLQGMVSPYIIIRNTENAILSSPLMGRGTDIYNTIVSFGIYCYENYFADIQQLNPEAYREFSKDFKKALVEEGVVIPKEPLAVKEIIDSQKEVDEECMIDEECKSGQCYMERCQPADFVREWKKTGEDCIHDDQCLTGYCYSGICSVPMGETAGIGEECKEDRDCYSFRCVANICRPNKMDELGNLIPQSIREQCAVDEDCDSGHCRRVKSVKDEKEFSICAKGRCSMCNEDIDCASGHSCKGGKCRPDTLLKDDEECCGDEDCVSGDCEDVFTTKRIAGYTIKKANKVCVTKMKEKKRLASESIEEIPDFIQSFSSLELPKGKLRTIFKKK